MKTSSDIIWARGVVQKLARDPFRVVHLRRRHELLSEDEWEWTDDSCDAFVFASYELASAAAASLTADGEEHVHAIVYGAASEAQGWESKIRREQRARLVDFEADADAAERVRQHQANLERMHLA